MLRYDRQIKTGLVTLYDIWPGNGAGLFLQLRSPQGLMLAKINFYLVKHEIKTTATHVYSGL